MLACNLKQTKTRSQSRYMEEGDVDLREKAPAAASISMVSDSQIVTTILETPGKDARPKQSAKLWSKQKAYVPTVLVCYVLLVQSPRGEI